MWNTAKGVLRGKFVALNVNIRKEEMPQIISAPTHKNLEKEEKNKPEANRMEGIKIRAEINKIEIEKIEETNEMKSCFCNRSIKFKISGKIDKGEKEMTQTTIIRNKARLLL